MSLPPPLLSGPPEPSPHRILVVDGEVLSRLVIADYLRECGYRVNEAANAQEAMEVLGNSEIVIDLVLAEVRLPGELDGFALARWLRSHHPEVKIMLSSGPSRAADVAGELCESGPHLKKPYDPQHALSRIKQLLARSERKPAALGGKTARLA